MTDAGPLATAVDLIVGMDAELLGITWRSVRIAVSSTILATAFGLPIAGALALFRFPGRRAVITVFNALMALPTVVVALALYGLLSRSGPLGYLDLLFTPGAVIVGQAVLILPIVVSLAAAAILQADHRVWETAVALGARRWRRLTTVLAEQSAAIVAAVLSAFGRAIGEVGVSMMLGGNIRHYTRTMTTTIALESNRGAFDLAIALGIVLVTLALLINGALRALTESSRSTRSAQGTAGSVS